MERLSGTSITGRFTALATTLEIHTSYLTKALQMIYQLDELDLSKCAFLIGSSTDPQPLLRLRHLLTATYAKEHLSINPDIPVRRRNFEVEAQTFISATVGRPSGHHANAEEFVRDLNLKLEALNTRGLELSISGSPVNFEMHDFDSHLLPEDLFDEVGWREYELEFGSGKQGKVWGVDILLNRHMDGSIFPVRLLHIAVEGLKALWRLSKNGINAPRIVQSVQTGVLERPNGPLEKLIDKFKERPMLWVRGYWAQSFWNDLWPTWSSEAQWQKGGSYNIEVQRYGHWNGSLGVKEDMHALQWRNANVSLVRAYTERHMAAVLAKRTTISNDSRRIINLINEPLDPSDDGRIKIVTNRIRKKWISAGHVVAHVKAWEDFGIRSNESLSRALNAIESGPNGNKHYAISPVGFEDQGHLLTSFSWRRTGAVTLDVHFTDQLDFADLRGWNKLFR